MVNVTSDSIHIRDANFFKFHSRKNPRSHESLKNTSEFIGHVQQARWRILYLIPGKYPTLMIRR